MKFCFTLSGSGRNLPKLPDFTVISGVWLSFKNPFHFIQELAGFARNKLEAGISLLKKFIIF
jgi:hypothetical protein